MTKGRKKIIIVGWMDYDKSIKHFLEDSFTYSRPTTLSLAIEKLELLEKVEKAGIRPVAEIPPYDHQNCNCKDCMYKAGYGQALIIANAHLAKKLEGIWENCRRMILG